MGPFKRLQPIRRLTGFLFIRKGRSLRPDRIYLYPLRRYPIYNFLVYVTYSKQLLGVVLEKTFTAVYVIVVHAKAVLFLILTDRMQLRIQFVAGVGLLLLKTYYTVYEFYNMVQVFWQINPYDQPIYTLREIAMGYIDFMDRLLPKPEFYFIIVSKLDGPDGLTTVFALYWLEAAIDLLYDIENDEYTAYDELLFDQAGNKIPLFPWSDLVPY